MGQGAGRIDREILNAQLRHWENVFSEAEDMFGLEPSEPARMAAGLFRAEGTKKILELGAGQGRDSLFFACSGFSVHALDYAEKSAATLSEKARQFGLSGRITVIRHDVREPLPFENETFDACYSHMLYCMAMTTKELETLSNEVRRVLRPRGLNVYTVRHTGDAHFGVGVYRGEGLYETGGFVVHFFSGEMVKRLAKGYDLVGIDEFEEGDLPRKLFRVTMRNMERTEAMRRERHHSPVSSMGRGRTVSSWMPGLQDGNAFAAGRAPFNHRGPTVALPVRIINPLSR